MRGILLRLTVVLVSLPALSLGGPVPAQAAGVQPTQWIAKMYTEAYGRAPSPSEWSFWTAYYASNACATGTLSTLGSAIYTSAPFTDAYPEASAKAQRVMALVRGVYSHDPNSNDWSTYYTPYANGSQTWSQVVNAIFDNGVFGQLVVPGVCGSAPDYGFGYSRPLDVLAGGSRTESTLQSQLNAAQSSCGTVTLNPTELVRIGNTQYLNVPGCVTLTTSGGPGLSAYASMGRIVPDGLTCQVFWCSHTALVLLGKGAKLTNVWVDGAGADPSQVQVANVETADTAGANGTTISSDRLTDPGPNGTAVRLDGFGTTGVACTGVTVSGSLITGYAGHRSQDAMGQARWANGITDLCEGASITNNQLVDLTDRAITIEGERYRIPPPLLPVSATVAAGSTTFASGTSLGLSYSYTYTSPQAVESGVAPPTSVKTTAAGQQVNVSALSGIPASVGSVNFYLWAPFVTPVLRERTVAVSGGATPAFAMTALPPPGAPGPVDLEHQSVKATQHSLVSGNTIVSAGNPAFAALSADPIGECTTPYTSGSVAQSIVPTTCLDLPDISVVPGSSPPTTQLDPRDFTGSSVTGNSFWTGSRTDFFVGLMVGSQAAWGPSGPIGTGANFTNNTVGVTPTRVNMGIDTNGMFNIDMSGNTTAASSYTLVDSNPGILDNKCPQQVWGYNGFSATFVAGSDVPPATSNSWLDCMAPSPPAAMDRLAVGTGSASLTFVGATTGVRFSPFGINYAAIGGSSGTPYATLVKDFRTLRHAGYNMIRPLLQFSDFVDAPSPGFPDGTPDQANLATLQGAVSLAARDGLYVDVTGLFETDPAHSPAWYDALTADGGETHGRWQAQQVFWSAVAGQLRDDPNVLDYNLMNEPFISGAGDGTAWNTGCLGTPPICFTQAITLNPNGRSADSIVQSWISTMTSAIRGTGDTHLITVGQLPLNGGGFESTNTAPLLSYVSVHEYPHAGVDGINAALANEAAFQAGKPLVIEEWYPLNNADGNELSGWIASSMQTANGSVTGWVGQWPTRCSFLAMGNPSGCSNDTVGLGLVAARTVIDVALTVRSPKGFPEV